jgi:uncharacterized protein (TIGR02246 family)
MSNDEQAIRDLIETWCRATEAGDIDAILPLMADDIVFLTPGRAPFGKKEFAASGSPKENGPRIQVQPGVQEIRVSGDLAYCWLKLAVTVTPPTGEPMKMGGHTIGIYRREGGRWVLARDANLVAPV